MPERRSDIRGDMIEATTFYKRGCELFFSSVDGDQGLVDGVNFLVKAARLMHVDAMAHVGYCYLQGVGVPVNVPLGLNMLNEAVRGGSYEAHNTVGHCLQFGVGFAKDPQRAVRHYHYAASVKEASALTNLGFCLLEGCGVEKDQQRAFGLFQEAAENMHPVALAHLGFCHQFGLGTATNRGEAERSYRLGAKTVQLSQQRPPTFCCSAQYTGSVELVAIKVYPVPLSMFRGPAQVRLAAWFCLPGGQYQEFSNLMTKAADAGDPIGIDARPMVKSFSATLPLLSTSPHGEVGGDRTVGCSDGSNFLGSLATSFLSSSASSGNDSVDSLQAGSPGSDSTQRKHVTRRFASYTAKRRLVKDQK